MMAAIAGGGMRTLGGSATLTATGGKAAGTGVAGDENEKANQKIPLPIQTFLWRQTRYPIRRFYVLVAVTSMNINE